MKKSIILSSLFVIILILGACQSNTENGPRVKDLEIAVIGEIPKIGEENISFTGIDFNEIDDNDLLYDAIFIMENYLEEAAEYTNVQRFKNSSKPTFFIGTKASYLPFIETENPLPYNDYAKKLGISNYEIAGIIYVNDDTGYRNFTIDVPIEEEKISIEQQSKIFSEVFEILRKNKLHKED